MKDKQLEGSIAIIGFSKEMSPLDPLWPSTHRALLPICGKALIIHQLESIIALGIKHVRIAGSVQQWAVRKRIRDGSEWGIKIKYSDLHAEDLKAECIASVGSCIYLLGDQLGSSFEKFQLSETYTGKDQTGFFTADKKSTIINPNNRSYKNSVRTVKEYHQANIDVLSNHLQFNINGAKIHNDNAYMDWDSYIAPDAHIGKNVFVSKHCKISRQAKLEDNCILSHGVVVGSGTKLRNVTVLTNCVIAANQAIEDCVITSSGMFDFNEKYWLFDHEGGLGSTRDNKEEKTGLPSAKVNF